MIETLVELGIAWEIKGGPRNRLFAYDAYWRSSARARSRSERAARRIDLDSGQTDPVVNPLACGEVSQQAYRELIERLRQVAHRQDRLASLLAERGGDRHLLHLPLRKAGKGVEEAGHMAIKAAQIRH